LRFDDGSAHKLTKDFSGSSPDNDKKMTISVWAKRGNVTTGSTQVILANYNAVRFLGELAWDGTDILRFDPGGDGNGSSNAYTVQTTALFRDVSSWYHIVLAYDSTQGTDTNRVKLYVNGTQQTLTAKSGHTFPPQNYAHLYSYAGANNTIGEFGAGFDSGELDGYLSEFNFIDGLTLDPTYFGETKNGVWIAKKYTGSYGTNGYRLQFNQTGVGTASTSTIGADTSGNNNHFTSSGIVASDCNMPDSPENNFATILSTQNQASATLSEGNLKAVGTGNNWDNLQSTFAVSSGKWYWEVKVLSIPELNSFAAGIHQTGFPAQSLHWYSSNYTASDDGIVFGVLDVNEKVTNTTTSSFTLGIANNSIVQFRLNLDDNELSVSVDGSDKGKLFDITANVEYTPALSIYKTTSCTMNFGQDSTFVGTETAGGNADENGNGDFHSAVPSGYLSLCTANLPEPTIGPNSLTQADDYFNTVLYSGNGGTQNITGFGFQPDWIWDKSRNNTFSHMLVDSSRGVGKYLRTNTNGAEVDDASILTHFISDGVTVGDINGNASGSSSVMWGWKANGGTTSSNSDGSITSTVQANTTAGFSIVTATSPSSGTWSVGHGLSKKPDMIIQKYLASSSRWTVWHNILTSGQYLGLNESNAIASSGTPFNFNITDSVIGGNADYDATSTAVVYYVFHSVEGYSKIGVYYPNNTTDNTFVYTGFKPAMVILKGAEINNQEWGILDNKRPGYNSVYFLQPQSTAAESTSNIVDFLSNGFKIRETGGVGYLTSKYIYMAFAEAPFKYANAG
jgi:hypothetical protein